MKTGLQGMKQTTPWDVVDEKAKIEEEMKAKQQKEDEELQKQSDNWKVIIEDLVYIDDLDFLCYTTLTPKSSTISVTQTWIDSPEANLEQTIEHKDENDIPNFYPVIAHLKGHKNGDPPVIHYVFQSGCLISGEKNMRESTDMAEINRELYPASKPQSTGN